MQLTGIYAITDDTLLPPDRLLAAASEAITAGIRTLQYRSKNTDAHLRLETARALQALCATHAIPLLINDDIELCAAIGAAGVHLGRQDAPLGDARALLGDEAIVGITCHASLEDALEAERRGASYVAFGRFFPSRTKPLAPPADLALLGAARAALNVPIVAIGGINTENGAAVLRAGADMLACVHALFGSEDVGRQTRAMVELYTRTALELSADRTQHE